MDAKLRQEAVDDLLDYCRNASHEMKTGRLLAPILLGRAWSGGQDDYDLVAALQHLIAAALDRWRQKFGVGHHPRDDSQELMDRLKADLAMKHAQLERLSLVWAYYVEHLSTAQIADVHGSVPRTIQLKIAAGRAEVAELVARQRRTVVSPQNTPAHHQADVNGQQPFEPAMTVPVAQQAAVRRAPPSHVEADGSPQHAPVTPHRRTTKAVDQRILGDHVQAVIGPVAGPVNQYQTQHIHHHGPASASDPAQDASTSLFWTCMALTAVAGYWLIHTIPWISVGALVLITGWRTLRHAWPGTHRWSAERGDDERWWFVGYIGAWLTALAWSVFMLSRLSSMVPTPEFSPDRLTLLVSFIGISLIIVWLSTVDVLLWVYSAMPRWWPARWLTRHAHWCWQQRWTLLGITWLMVVVFSGSNLLAMATLGG